MLSGCSDFWLRAGWLIDPEGRRSLPDPVLRVKDGRIAFVGHTTEITGPVPVVDLGACYLLPGLIDCHTHLTYEMDDDYLTGFVKETAADFALRGAANARKTLEAGITTVRDLGSVYFTDVALQKAISRGRIPGPDVVPCGHILTVPGGNGDITGFAPGILERDFRGGVISSLPDAAAAVRYQVKHGARWIKVAASGGVVSYDASADSLHLSPAELASITEEAERLGVRVAAHAHSAQSIRACIEAGIGSIEHGTFAGEDELELLYKTGTPLVPTTSVLDVLDPATLPDPIAGKMRDAIERGRAGLKSAIRSGVEIVFGSDAGIVPHGRNFLELKALAELGMEPFSVLQAATNKAAAMLGLTDRGTVAPGMLADLIAVRDNPLESLSALETTEFVCKSGRIVKAPAQPLGADANMASSLGKVRGLA